jgi:hypothetical protein
MVIHTVKPTPKPIPLHPAISYLHLYRKDRPALVFDLMEPLRPIVDRTSHTFYPADFTIRSDGVCRLNPELARYVAYLVFAGSPNRAAVLLTSTREHTRDNNNLRTFSK